MSGEGNLKPELNDIDKLCDEVFRLVKGGDPGKSKGLTAFEIYEAVQKYPKLRSLFLWSD